MLPALLLGLASSLHCVAMCGPLLLAIPMERADRWAALGQMLTYHSGRILTYASMGMLFGLAGKGIALAGFQQTVSVLAGIFMLGMAFMTWRFEYLVTALPGFGSLSKWVQQKLGLLLRQRSSGAHFSMGLLNGLIPCGMVYVALAGSIATTNPLEGGLFMAIFGLGTLPMLLSVSMIGQSVKVLVRKKIRFVQPVLLVFAGCILLQRGLQIDLSRFESVVPKALLECH